MQIVHIIALEFKEYQYKEIKGNFFIIKGVLSSPIVCRLPCKSFQVIRSSKDFTISIWTSQRHVTTYNCKESIKWTETKNEW